MVISAPSARGGNCIPLICRLFRPSSELVLGPSRKFTPRIDRIEARLSGLIWRHYFRIARQPAAGEVFLQHTPSGIIGTIFTRLS